MQHRADVLGQHLLILVTFDTRALKEQELELNNKLKPISVALRKDSFLRRQKDIDNFEDVVRDVCARKKCIVEMCEFYNTVLTQLKYCVTQDRGCKRYCCYYLVRCKVLYAKLAPAYEVRSLDAPRWQYWDYLVWQILHECKELLGTLRFL